jgi:MFS family permease
VLKALCGGGLGVAGISFVLVFLVANQTIAMLILIFSCMALGLCSPNLWTMTQILAGTQTAGKWTGLENFCGNLAGISAPIVAGYVVDRTGSFFWAFAITGAIALVGAVAYFFVVGQVVPVSWKSHSSRTE